MDLDAELYRRRWRKFQKYRKERGLPWTALFTLRLLALRTLKRLDRWIIAIEQDRFLIGENTVASEYNTLEENRKWADSYDWSRGGEEWTNDARSLRAIDPGEWKNRLVTEMMLKYIRPGSVVLEMGAGAGRWTRILAQRCSRVLAADISEVALNNCKKNLADYQNIQYLLVGNGLPDEIPDESVDFIWSYDVFVHVNPNDTARYLAYFKGKLKPGGIAIIHHPGEYRSSSDRVNGWRSFMTGRFFAHLLEGNGMRLLEQNRALPHKWGDVITVFTKDGKPGRNGP